MLLRSQQAIAQHNVTGTIIDDAGDALPGATIKVKDTTTGTVSDNDGTFSLTVADKNAVLLVFFLGFETREIPLNGRSAIEVALGDDAELLEEVVVVGYGTARKSDLTGSVSTVKVEDRVARQSNTVDQLLHRLSGSVDFYDKTTKDLLQNIPIPTSSGFGNLLINRGTINNTGVELALQAVLVDTKQIDLSIGGNIAFNKTKIENLGIPLDENLVDDAYGQRFYYLGATISRGNIFIEGEESSLFYGFASDCIYQTGDDLIGNAQAGDIRIVDQNADGVIDNQDRKVIGNPNPDFIYGMNLSLQVGDLSVSALLNGVYGNDIINGNLLQLGNVEGISRNILPAAYHNAWRPEAQSNTFPRIGYTTIAAIAISDRYVEDGSYLRLANVIIGYDLPIKSGVFTGVNVYVSGQNLVTWTGYSGYDPEVTTFLSNGLINGVDWNGAPATCSSVLILTFNHQS